MPGIEQTTKKKRQNEDETPPISLVDPKVVLENVFKQLGKPENLCPTAPCLTRATPINQHSFRVQVYCKGDESKGIGASPSLTDTFWVTVNDKGAIVNSDPAIDKKY